MEFEFASTLGTSASEASYNTVIASSGKLQLKHLPFQPITIARDKFDDNNLGGRCNCIVF